MTAHYPGRAAIETYGAGGFGFAGMSHRGSIVALPSGIYAWNMNPASLTPDDFAMAIAEKDAFDLLLIGMGTEMARPPRPVRAALEAAGHPQAPAVAARAREAHAKTLADLGELPGPPAQWPGPWRRQGALPAG